MRCVDVGFRRITFEVAFIMEGGFIRETENAWKSLGSRGWYRIERRSWRISKLLAGGAIVESRGD